MDERLKEAVAFVEESGLVKYSLEVGGIAAPFYWFSINVDWSELVDLSVIGDRVVR